MIQHHQAGAPRKSGGATAIILALIAAASFTTASAAADFGNAAAPIIAEPENFGVPCSIGAPPWSPPITAAILPWPSVWLGRFSGGRPDPLNYGLVDWREEQVCFASRTACQAWIKDLRHAFHRPEGYWTCLLLR